MASISTDKNGTRRIQFFDSQGQRKAIRLSKVSMKTAEDICRKVEALNSATIHGEPLSNAMSEWLADLDGKLREKLARVGLVVRRDATNLGAFIQGYIDKRTDVKSATLTNWGHTQRCLTAYFGPDRPLSSITAGDAADWERWLQTGAARENRYGETKATEGLSKNTARKRVSNAKQFFADAVSRDLIRKNPFADMSGAVGGNRDRDYFVSREEADKVLAKCPDAQWRLVFALSRYGGLRCPSEHLGLRWGDIDWEAGRMTVHSPKTEHHEGKAFRVVPIFPELRPYLEAVWDEAEEGAEHVITCRRDMAANLRTRMRKIIKRAGLTPWPKLFHNLRATRETELAEQFPMHVVCQWIGNSAAIAAKHYLQTTDEHYEKAAQNAAQSAAILGAPTATESHVELKNPPKTVIPAILYSCPVGDEGLEPPTLSV